MAIRKEYMSGPYRCFAVQNLPAGTVALTGQGLAPLTLFISEKRLSWGSHQVPGRLGSLCLPS